MTARALVDALLSTLLAPPCAACGRVLDRPLDGAVCARCWGRIAFITPPICNGCGDPLPSWRIASCAAGRCARCRRREAALDRVRAIGPYEGELRAIVHALKYGGRRTVARRLGELMRAEGTDLLAGADAIVPVPLHPRRRRQRGFNQATLLAEHLGMPVRHVLRRVVHTHPQANLPAARRHKNVRNVFAVRPLTPTLPPFRGERGPEGEDWGEDVGARGRVSPGPPLPLEGGEGWGEGVRGRVLVLVDDVITTGATLQECARALKAAGAREVRALTAARVVSARPPAPDR